MKKMVAGLMLAMYILTNSVPALASVQDCEQGLHSPLVFYSKNLVAQTKTGEHIVKVNGKEAICFIYTESYDVVYYCQSCGTYIHSTMNVPDVHSLGM